MSPCGDVSKFRKASSLVTSHNNGQSVRKPRKVTGVRNINEEAAFHRFFSVAAGLYNMTNDANVPGCVGCSAGRRARYIRQWMMPTATRKKSLACRQSTAQTQRRDVAVALYSDRLGVLVVSLPLRQRSSFQNHTPYRKRSQ